MSVGQVLLFVVSCLNVASGFLLVHNVPRNVTRTLRVSNGGPYGDWGEPHFCAEGSYAVGYDMKIEGKQKSGDDTSLNGILLYCETVEGSEFGGHVESTEGPWGHWVGITQCDHTHGLHHFLKAFSLQVEEYQGSGDDTEANYIKFLCQDLQSNTQQYELAHPPGEGFWGDYGEWSESCGPNSAICGISTRVEKSQHGDDDTALNDVVLYCCA